MFVCFYMFTKQIRSNTCFIRSSDCRTSSSFSKTVPFFFQTHTICYSETFIRLHSHHTHLPPTQVFYLPTPQHISLQSLDLTQLTHISSHNLHRSSLVYISKIYKYFYSFRKATNNMFLQTFISNKYLKKY